MKSPSPYRNMKREGIRSATAVQRTSFTRCNSSFSTLKLSRISEPVLEAPMYMRRNITAGCWPLIRCTDRYKSRMSASTSQRGIARSKLDALEMNSSQRMPKRAALLAFEWKVRCPVLESHAIQKTASFCVSRSSPWYVSALSLVTSKKVGAGGIMAMFIAWLSSWSELTDGQEKNCSRNCTR